MKVIFISIALHIIAAFIAGVVTVATYVMTEDAQFEEPPKVEEESPQAEVKVQIERKPTVVKSMGNFQARPISNIAVDAVAVDLPTMSETFTLSAGFGGVRGVGLLAGSRGKLELGVSNIKVFGLQARGEKVLFLIEAGRRMVLDSKGGMNSYRVIKDEVSGMVSELSAGTLYNVMLYDHGMTKLFKPQLVAAGATSTDELRSWLRSVNNTLGSIGIKGGKRALIETKIEKYPEFYEGLRMDPTMQAVIHKALEMNVDAIFQIAGDHKGFTGIRLKNTAREIAAAKDKREKWLANRTNRELYEAHEAEKREMRKRIAKAHEKHNQERAKKGLPPKVLGDHMDNNAKYFGLTWKTKAPKIPPPHPPHKWQDEDSIRRYYHEFTQQEFHRKGKTPPSINVILFLAGDETFPQAREEQVKRFVGFFNGKYRILRGENEIRMAAAIK